MKLDKTAFGLSLALVLALCGPAAAESPPPFPDFTFKRVKPPMCVWARFAGDVNKAGAALNLSYAIDTKTPTISSVWRALFMQDGTRHTCALQKKLTSTYTNLPIRRRLIESDLTVMELGFISN